jgi:hypothetical protein
MIYYVINVKMIDFGKEEELRILFRDIWMRIILNINVNGVEK